MDICHQCFYYYKTYVSIDTDITHLNCYRKKKIFYVLAGELPDINNMIMQQSILLPFVHEPHHNRFRHHSSNDSSDTEAEIWNQGVDAEQPPVRTGMVGNPYYANHGAGNPNVQEQFDIISFSGDFLPPLSFKEDHQLAPWRIQHNLRTATMI
jgi:hypothetical protein